MGLEYIKTLVNGLRKRIENIPQSDWKQNDETAQSYIKNRIGGYVKPVEETVVVKRVDASSSSYWGGYAGFYMYQAFVPCDEIPTEEELANAVLVGDMYSGTVPLSVFQRNENCYYLNSKEIPEDLWQTDKAIPPLVVVYKNMGDDRPGIAFPYCYNSYINVSIDTLTYKTTKDTLIKIPGEYVDSDWSNFIVNITATTDSDGNDTYTADKTFAEIITASSAGKNVVALFAGGYLPLNMAPPAAPFIVFKGFNSGPLTMDVPTFVIQPWDDIIMYSSTFTDNNAIHFTQQTITDEQKAQARDNIDAGLADVYLSSPSTKDICEAVVQAYKLPRNIIINSVIDGTNNQECWTMVLYPPTTVYSGSGYKRYFGIAVVGKENRTTQYTAESSMDGYKFFLGDDAALYYTKQELTRDQQTQARANIGLTPVAKTDAMTQSVGLDAETGELWTKPGTIDEMVEGEAAETVSGELTEVQTGGDDSLGITSALVGQIAKITAVDADGKPTAWEAVDMAGGVPTVSSADNGKFLRVEEGIWRATTVDNASGVSF